MLASGNDHKYVAAAPVQSSICEVVKLVQTELQDLLTWREEVTRRIRNLRQVADALEAVPRQLALDGTTTERFADRSRPQVRSNQSHLRLMRICRSSKARHDEFRFQHIPVSRKESLRNVRLLARLFADSGIVVAHDHRMLILETSQLRRVRNAVLVCVI